MFLGTTFESYLISRLLVSFQVPHLNLQEREIPKDLYVVLVPFEGVPVALYGLVVLLVRSLKETVNVPANVGPENNKRLG